MSSREERFADLKAATLFGGDGFPDKPQRCEIERVWKHGSQLVFKFEGVDTISAAEQLRGADVCIPLSERRELPEGEYYHSDLEGCEVVDAASRERLGRISAFIEEGGNGLLEVKRSGGSELLIPFTRAICVEIDVVRKRVAVKLPEGLLELNK